MAERRQRGMSKGPCPGCGKGDTHPSGGVCRSCVADLDRGREAATADRADPTRAWYRFSSQPHWNPSYYLSGVDTDADFERALGTVFTDLVMTLSPETKDPGYQGLDPKQYRLGGDLVTRAKGLPKGEHHGEFIRLTATQAKAINALDKLLCRALLAVADHARRDGRNLLTQLALGTLTMRDFNEETARETAAIHRQMNAVMAGTDAEDEE